jgi:hypothetical protein
MTNNYASENLKLPIATFLHKILINVIEHLYFPDIKGDKIHSKYA